MKGKVQQEESNPLLVTVELIPRETRMQHLKCTHFSRIYIDINTWPMIKKCHMIIGSRESGTGYQVDTDT
jgi:hypothetical protein